MIKSEMMVEYEKLTGLSAVKCIDSDTGFFEAQSDGYVEWLETCKQMLGEPVESGNFSCAGDCENCNRQDSFKKINYRGYEIEVERVPTSGGGTMLSFSIIRLSDGFEVDTSYEISAETVGVKVEELKERVDNEIKELEEVAE
jgi:hypothetical protein